MNAKLEFLKGISPFSALPVSILEEVAGHLEEITYHKDTEIYQQDVTSMKGVDIIVSGHYESFFYDTAGNKRVIELHERGFCYGGVSVLLNRRQSLRTVIFQGAV